MPEFKVVYNDGERYDAGSERFIACDIVEAKKVADNHAKKCGWYVESIEQVSD